MAANIRITASFVVIRVGYINKISYETDRQRRFSSGDKENFM